MNQCLRLRRRKVNVNFLYAVIFDHGLNKTLEVSLLLHYPAPFSSPKPCKSLAQFFPCYNCGIVPVIINQ